MDKLDWVKDEVSVWSETREGTSVRCVTEKTMDLWGYNKGRVLEDVDGPRNIKAKDKFTTKKPLLKRTDKVDLFYRIEKGSSRGLKK